MPFIDPFKYDDNDFQAMPFPPRPNPHPTSNGLSIANLRSSVSEATMFTPMLALPRSHVVFPPSQRDERLAAIALNPHLEPVLPEARERAIEKRARLTADQAILIFNQRRTKTSRTAALLAEEYGISSKAIRDIWTLKSWAAETRPHWSKIDDV